MDGPLPRDVAGRLASAAAGIDGVNTATVCSADGTLLGSTGTDDPAREAALASFVALRAAALPVDGDLRGMGRQLAGSTFSHLAITSDRGETLLYNLHQGAFLSIHIAPGRSGSVAGPVTALVRRVAAMADTSMRSS